MSSSSGGEMLKLLDEHAPRGKFCKDVLEEVWWPTVTWNRELLVSLAEYNFEEVPEWIIDQFLLPWARGPIGTTVSEEGFQRLRREER